GPFAHVPRNATLAADLERFFSRWRPDSHDYAVGLADSTVAPAGVDPVSDQEANELIALHANQRCLSLLADRKAKQAAKLAVVYGLVTPVSSAVITHLAPQTADGQLANAVDGVGSSQIGSPQLRGATTGTIGPAAGDATVVMGVNTAGTVRVNNLANLEALLNIIANMLEVGAILAGGILLLHGLFNRITVAQLMGMQVNLTPALRIAIGTGLVMFGLSAPGFINWFVASARDANLFS